MSQAQKEITQLYKQLEKAVKNEEGEKECLRILKLLEEIPVTVEVLQETNIGRNLNQLRASAPKEVSAKCKELCLKWKNSMSSQEKPKSLKPSDAPSTPAKNAMSPPSSTTTTPSKTLPKKHDFQAHPLVSSVGAERSTIRTLLCLSLCVEETDVELIIKKAVEIDDRKSRFFLTLCRILSDIAIWCNFTFRRCYSQPLQC
eukprot:TRINITY_DN8067_c0_g1_i3.p1 TRINITY_DN8067_c0_g1~~TRINITY_DN8067_c0_g1_i3.p1  ORF type:complete len:201 (-),score=40.29 TRINITY_DN8067_c0_g1_i3:103-705(-)